MKVSVESLQQSGVSARGFATDLQVRNDFLSSLLFFYVLGLIFVVFDSVDLGVGVLLLDLVDQGLQAAIFVRGAVARADDLSNHSQQGSSEYERLERRLTICICPVQGALRMSRLYASA